MIDAPRCAERFHFEGEHPMSRIVSIIIAVARHGIGSRGLKLLQCREINHDHGFRLDKWYLYGQCEDGRA
jgi:hypothetical protein